MAKNNLVIGWLLGILTASLFYTALIKADQIVDYYNWHNRTEKFVGGEFYSTYGSKFLFTYDRVVDVYKSPKGQYFGAIGRYIHPMKPIDVISILRSHGYKNPQYQQILLEEFGEDS